MNRSRYHECPHCTHQYECYAAGLQEHPLTPEEFDDLLQQFMDCAEIQALTPEEFDDLLQQFMDCAEIQAPREE
jgi:hypothetical protein